MRKGGNEGIAYSVLNHWITQFIVQTEVVSSLRWLMADTWPKSARERDGDGEMPAGNSMRNDAIKTSITMIRRIHIDLYVCTVHSENAKWSFIACTWRTKGKSSYNQICTYSMGSLHWCRVCVFVCCDERILRKTRERRAIRTEWNKCHTKNFILNKFGPRRINMPGVNEWQRKW